MPAGRSFWVFVFVIAALGLTGCEPYMSMTDRVPAQTRQAASLLPETPRYVGMVDLETTIRHLDELRGTNLADSLRRTENPSLRAFLDATGIDPATDVQAVYGALEEKEAFSAVLFANLTSEQMDRYLDRVPDGEGRATTYRDVLVYHLALGEAAGPSDTLSVAFVDEGMMAVATAPDRVTAMVNRHRAEQTGLDDNESYMTLVERVGRGSTAWLAGRDVVESALRDSGETSEAEKASETASEVSQAGLQRALSEWSDRVLGLSEVSSLEERTGGRVERLKRRLREQAVSITLTETALDGEVYLTMEDEASAASVVDVAKGAVAVMKLSRDDLDERHRNLLEEIRVDRTGSIVHLTFSLDRSQLREKLRGDGQDLAARRQQGAIRHSTYAVRR